MCISWIVATLTGCSNSLKTVKNGVKIRQKAKSLKTVETRRGTGSKYFYNTYRTITDSYPDNFVNEIVQPMCQCCALLLGGHNKLTGYYLYSPRPSQIVLGLLSCCQG